MVIEKICKITIRGVKLKSESFFSISYGVLDLLKKKILGGGFPLPPSGLNRLNPPMAGRSGCHPPTGFSNFSREWEELFL